MQGTQMKTTQTQSFNWQDLDPSDAYDRWRAAKLTAAEKCRDLAPVPLSNLADPSESAQQEIIRRCNLSNFALYESPLATDDSTTRRALRAFATRFGLRIAEAHRSGGDQGIVALRVSDAPAQRGYIPYSSRAMNWHTDGYYNAPENRISAFVLHCHSQAAEGGTNDILDPDILYIRLRDARPDLLRTLMHPQAMTIPENVEEDGTLRPASTGPVFYPDPGSGALQMRYTARTRSIAWRDDPATQEAAAFLRDHLTAGDPLSLRLRLSPGQGILNNNVLHNRTGFADTDERGRCIFRVRFHNRVGEQ